MTTPISISAETVKVAHPQQRTAEQHPVALHEGRRRGLQAALVSRTEKDAARSVAGQRAT